MMEWELLYDMQLDTWTDSLNRLVFGAGGIIGYARPTDLIWYGSDDLEPAAAGWDAACWAVLESGEIPAPYMLSNHGRGWERQNEDYDGHAPQRTAFSRVPVLTVAMAQRIGPWPSLAYCGDYWLSFKARTLGIHTRLSDRYVLHHHWAQEGRRRNEERWPAAQAEVERLISEMGPAAQFSKWEEP